MPSQQPADPPALRIPPPPAVRAAGWLIVLQAAGIVAFAVATGISGVQHEQMSTGAVLGQSAYFLALAAGVAACGIGLLRGRRWARTPSIVIQIIIGGIGFYTAVPSGQPGPGVALIAIAAVIGGALVTTQASAWVNSFPAPFGDDS